MHSQVFEKINPIYSTEGTMSVYFFIFLQGLDTVEFDDDIERSNTTVSLVSMTLPYSIL